jgi:Zn finger protein HypA/HybF involved in hydrogenase expression
MKRKSRARFWCLKCDKRIPPDTILLHLKFKPERIEFECPICHEEVKENT